MGSLAKAEFKTKLSAAEIIKRTRISQGKKIELNLTRSDSQKPRLYLLGIKKAITAIYSNLTNEENYQTLQESLEH